MNSEHTTGTGGHWKLAIGGLVAMAAAMGIGRFVYTPILPMMVQDLGLSAAQAGMIASSNFLGYLLGAMIAATSVLTGSPRRWLLTALLASALTTLAMAWVESYLGFLLVRFIGGLVSSWVMVFASTLVIARLTEAGRGELTALLFGGVGVGIVLASVISWIAAETGGGWRNAWMISGMVAIAAAALVGVLVPDRKPVAAAAPAGNAESRAIGGLLAAYALFGFGYVITATFLVQLVRSASYSPDIEALVWIVVGVTAAPSVWAWNKHATTVGNSRAFSRACLVLAVGVATSVLLPGLFGLIPGAILLGATFMGITALGLMEARSRSGKDPRQTLAMMTAAFGAGQIVGPATGGYMADLLGSFTAPSLLASLTLILAAWLVIPRSRA